MMPRLLAQLRQSCQQRLGVFMLRDPGLHRVTGNVFSGVIYEFFKCFSLAKKLGMVDG